ncbi:hypothetical protein [Terribacillus sp. JSM ZJ617]|uniref:hypothetical protein n=1 Tax=Terribacillus sp. JSM ZJ617 TaxID=3342119 RepID=UPI0035A82C99
MTIIPIVGLLSILSVFAVIFFCIRWLVRKQWYSILSVLCVHAALSYLHRNDLLEWDLEGRLLLVMTFICSMLILLKLTAILGDKKKKRTA